MQGVELEALEREQVRLAGMVSQVDASDFGLLDDGGACALTLVAGVDVAYWPPAGATVPAPSPERAAAALVVLSFPDLCQVYSDVLEVDVALPYLPGLLGFRECPAYVRLLQRAAQAGVHAQVVLVDGCGVLHPRRCGSASQLGLAVGVPTIGVAKNLLAVEGLVTNSVREAMRRKQEETEATAASGRQVEAQQVQQQEHVEPAQAQRAQQTQQEQPSPAAAVLLSGSSGDVLGTAVCSSGVRRPIYVSVGHGLSLQTAVAVVRRCFRWISAPGSSVQYRMPEPLRLADQLASAHVRRALHGRP